MDNFLDFNDIEQNEPLTKVKFPDLICDVIDLNTEDKIRLLKFIYADLNLLTIKEASDKLGITPNGVRLTKELICLGGKKYVRLESNN